MRTHDTSAFGPRLPDFDFLVALHSQDAQAFESFRSRMLEEAIAHAPEAHQPGLRKLLERINVAREAASDPFEAAVMATRMMHERLLALGEAWGELRDATARFQADWVIERARQH